MAVVLHPPQPSVARRHLFVSHVETNGCEQALPNAPKITTGEVVVQKMGELVQA